MDFFQRQIFETEDGSTSIRLLMTDEQYHSFHGACNESMHIYIEAGLQHRMEDEIHILEAGFGTGLNAILTFMHRGERTIAYDTIEAYPLTLAEVEQLNYGRMREFPMEVYRQMHEAASGTAVVWDKRFLFTKHLARFEEVVLPEQRYHLVYYDMFNPDLQPELWTGACFERVYAAMAVGGELLTYCAKGRVKRALKAVGFTIESLQGPIGKREITRAIKG